LSRWAANEQFESLVASILRNTPLRSPSVLAPKSLRRMLQISEGITANIFHMINNLAIEAIESGREQITNEAPAGAVLHQCIRLLLGAYCAPGHHGYQRA